MGNFLLGLCVALAIAAGVYYYLVIYAVQEEPAQQEERGASLDLKINEPNRIPPGAVMEDGTLPE